MPEVIKKSSGATIIANEPTAKGISPITVALQRYLEHTLSVTHVQVIEILSNGLFYGRYLLITECLFLPIEIRLTLRIIVW